MVGTGSHKYEIPGLHTFPIAVVEENTTTSNYHVQFVLCMRCLLRRSDGDGQGYVETTALQQPDGVLARRTWKMHLSLGKTQHADSITLGHCSTMVEAAELTMKLPRAAPDSSGASSAETFARGSISPLAEAR